MISAFILLGLAQVTVPHTFTYEAPADIQSASVAGTFNNWNKDADPMKLVGTRLWKITKNLTPGVHQYKFVLNGVNWITDPKSEKDVDDGNGNTNSVLTLMTADMKEPVSRTDAKVTASALMHRPEEPFLSYDRGRLRIRLQSRKGDLKSARFVTGGKAYEMALGAGDEYADVHEAVIPWQAGKEANYIFQVTSGSKTFTYGAAGLSGGFFKLNKASVTPFDVPSWPESKVVYQIFPDRFANGDKTNDPANVVAWDGTPTYSNYFGGDVAGVIEKIPYLKDLGVGAIYFNPIFQSPVNHGYETTDYHLIEPRFGTNEEFGVMTRKLRQNGIRTVLDGVFNHTATNFGPFADILKNGESSKFKDWYFIKSYPVKVGDPPNYEAWFGFPSLPKVNTGSREASDYLQGVPGFWDKQADIAGWRLDVGNEIPAPFWREFRKKVKALGRDRWIVGEVWGDGSQWLKGDQWDSVMGYQFRDAVLKFIANGTSKPSEYYRQLMKVNDSYAPAVSRNLMILLGSHDTPRILTLCHDDPRLAMLAATLQLTWVGAPSIYYGDEIGMAGDRDPDNRRGMTWDKATADNPMLRHYRKLIAARNRSKALQSGDPKLLVANDERGVLAYSRTLGKEVAITVVNRSDNPAALSVSIPNGRYDGVLSANGLLVQNGKAKIAVGPKASAVFVKRP